VPSGSVTHAVTALRRTYLSITLPTRLERAVRSAERESGHGLARTTDLSRVKRDCTRAASAGSTWKWAGYGTGQEDSSFGLFAVVSAGFCSLEPFKVQLRSIGPARHVRLRPADRTHGDTRPVEELALFNAAFLALLVRRAAEEYELRSGGRSLPSAISSSHWPCTARLVASSRAT
jgi:hypothetical protein